MAQRLVETYGIGDPVELLLQDEDGDAWRPARIVGRQHPGVWALADDRRLWFVTNGKHIRPQQPAPLPGK